MKGRIYSIIFILFSFVAFGQQEPQYTQWYWNQFAINPAHAGIRKCIELKTQLRAQYTGIDGTPYHGNFSITAPIKKRRRTSFIYPRQGIGLKLTSEKTGIFLSNNLNLAYAAHINFTQDNRLSVGIEAGIRQLSVDMSRVTTQEFDPELHKYVSNWMPDANVGFWWNTKNYYVGLAFRDLIGTKWHNIGIESKYDLHAYLNGGYRFVGKNGFSIYPSMLFKIPVKGKTDADLVLLFDHNNQFSYTIGFRTQEAVMIGFQVKIKEVFGIGYSFDYVFKPLGGFPNSSHELTLTFSGCRSYVKTRTGCDLF